MPYAYVDAVGNVLSKSTVVRTLAQAQAIMPDVTTIIAGAPAMLIPFLAASAQQPYYHRKTSGDGTDISHYTQIERLKPLKIARAAEIDARTEELIEAGFVASNSKRFRITDCAMLRYQVMFESRSAGVSYPILVNTYDNDNVQSLPDASGVVTFVEEIFLGHQAIIASGSALKKQIIDATTIAEIEAVEDNR